MAIAASLVVRISTEYGSFVRGMKQAEKDLTRFGKQAKRLGRDLSTDLTLPIVALGAVLFKAASDLERTENMFNSSFGGMAAAARDWSEQTANALGLSADDVRVTMARFNELSVSMGVSGASALVMAKGFTQLTLDLMAYRNISAEEATGALTSAMAGRMKGLKDLGIVVKDADVEETALRLGIIRTGQTMTTAQKNIAGYITTMDAMRKVHGEMARAGDAPAVMLMKIKQQAEEVAQTLGTALMPGMQTIVGWALALAQHLKSLAEWFQKLPPWVRGTTVAIAGLAAAIGPALWLLGTLILLLPKIKMAFMLAFGTAAGTMLAATVAIVAMGAAVLAAANNWTALKLQVRLAWSGMVGAIWDGTESVLRAMAVLANATGRSGVGTMLSAAADAVAADQIKILASQRAAINALDAQLRQEIADSGGGGLGTGAGAGAGQRAEILALAAEARRLAAAGTVPKGYDPKAGIGALPADVMKRYAEETAKASLANELFIKSEERIAAAARSSTDRMAYWAQRMADDADLVRQKFENMATSIEGSLTNLFSDVLMGQADAFKRFLDTILRMLADFAAQELVRSLFMPFLQQAALSFALPSAPNLGTGLMGNPLPAPSLVGARSGGDTFHINTYLAPNLIDARSGQAWLRENEGVITEAVIAGVRKSGAARQALVGR